MFWNRNQPPTTAEAVAAFLNSKRAAGRAQKTIGKLEYALAFLSGEFPGRLPLRLEELEAFFGGLQARGTLGDATQLLIFDSTKQLYDFAHGRYGIESPFLRPAREGGLQRPRLRRKDPWAFTREEIYRILSTNQSFPQVYAALHLVLDTAGRPGEAYRVARQDVRGGHVVLRGKMGEENVVLTEKTRIALLRWMTEHAGPGLWTQETQHGFEEMIGRAFKRAGVKGYPYMLRHTVATHLADAGLSGVVIKETLRHSTSRMADRYVQRSPRRVAEAMSRHGPLADWEGYYQRPLSLVEEEETPASG